VKFTETKLAGAFIVDVDERLDERGFFARTFCQREFAAHGLKTTIAQTNMSFNHTAGTLRGMHFQFPPAAETKFIRCPLGALYDVIVDLRPESATYGHHIGVELTERNHQALYIPERFGHGFITLVDNTVAGYQVGEFYLPGLEGGLRYDDPDLGIDWPRRPTIVSDKDGAWPSLAAQRATIEAQMVAS
jgi:dTDP-4-dehydrorhamnose 3,5-epimerase